MAELFIKESDINITLLETKLKEIDGLIRSGSFTTREDSSRNELGSAVSIAIQQFLQNIKASSTASVATKITYGSINSSQHYRDFWSAVRDDLNALFAEADRLGKLVSDHHNYIMSDVQNLLLKLKTANAKLATYELFASTSTPNLRSLVENFNDISQLEIGSALLVDTECNIDTVQGIITMGISSEELIKKPDVNSITIAAANSNGEVFNNTTLMGTINSGDFYLFQYEHTSTISTTYRLVLDFTVKLETPSIINYIRIVPNNFGTKTWPRIVAMDVSLNGIDSSDIKAELLGNNSDDTQFILAPYMSNYAGEGRFAFLPKKIQYIHFTIEQTSPYFDSIRNLYRWAIGIKNIEIVGRRYENSSEVISKDYTINSGIEEITLDADELPQLLFADSVLASEADIKHDISVDSGMTWKEIAPKYLNKQDLNVPEVIYVNSVDPDGNTTGATHLNTTLQTNKIRYRLRLSKNTSIIPDQDLVPYISPVVRKITLSIISPEAI